MGMNVSLEGRDTLQQKLLERDTARETGLLYSVATRRARVCLKALNIVTSTRHTMFGLGWPDFEEGRHSRIQTYLPLLEHSYPFWDAPTV